MKEILDVPDRLIPVISNKVYVASFVVDFNLTFTHVLPPFKPHTERAHPGHVKRPPSLKRFGLVDRVKRGLCDSEFVICFH